MTEKFFYCAYTRYLNIIYAYVTKFATSKTTRHIVIYHFVFTTRPGASKNLLNTAKWTETSDLPRSSFLFFGLPCSLLTR